jgi:hypothetical protein
MWFLILASASITAMFWTEDPGPLTLNVAGRAASAAGFVAVYVWSTELLPTSVRSGGMGLGSTAARVGSVAAPWAAQLGDLLPIPESLANDLPLALFGGQKEKRSISFASFDALKNASSFYQDRLGTNINIGKALLKKRAMMGFSYCTGFAIVAGVVALVVLPETRGTRCPETIVDAVLELRTAKTSALPIQIAAVLASIIGVGVAIIVGSIVAQATENRVGGAAAGVALGVAALAAVGGCYKACGPKKSWRQLHRQKGSCSCCS